MIASLLAFILFAGAFTSASEVAPYTGYRVSFKKDTLADSYYGIYKAAASSLLSETWPDFQETIGSGLFSLGFFVKGVKCVAADFDKSKASLISMTAGRNNLTIDVSGEALVFTFEFSYIFQVMTMNLFFGTGKFSVSSSVLKMFQEFTSEDFSTKLTVDWKTTVNSISGFDLFGGITAWILKLVPEHHTVKIPPLYTKSVQAAAVNFFKAWMEIKTPFYEDGSLNMTLKGYLQGIAETPKDYFSFGYDTRVIVDNRPYNKMVWKAQFDNIQNDDAKAQVCVTASLFTAMVEVRGKARDLMYRIDPEDIGLTGKVSELRQVMPRIDEVFAQDETLTIGCRTNGANDIVMINDGSLSETVGRIQIPVSCVFGAMPSGHLALAVDFVARADFTKEINDEGSFKGINGHLDNLSLYSFTVASAAVPVEDNYLIIRTVNEIAGKMKGLKMLPRNLAVSVPFTPASAKEVITKDVYCFNYA